MLSGGLVLALVVAAVEFIYESCAEARRRKVHSIYYIKYKSQYLTVKIETSRLWHLTVLINYATTSKYWNKIGTVLLDIEDDITFLEH